MASSSSIPFVRAFKGELSEDVARDLAQVLQDDFEPLVTDDRLAEVLARVFAEHEPRMMRMAITIGVAAVSINATIVGVAAGVTIAVLA